MPRKPLLLWFGWVATFSLAILCSWLVVKGVLRDRRVGEPVLALDVSQPTDWREQRFRAWGKGTYRLFISAVNWDSTHIGAPLGATLEVAVLNPRGEHAFAQQFPPGSTGLLLPINYSDAQLAELPLDGFALGHWLLRARVLGPDPRFKTATTTIKLHKQRYDPGMGGMMNYVMIFPAVLFTVLAFFAAVPLARQGSRAPIVLTILSAAVLVVALAA